MKKLQKEYISLSIPLFYTKKDTEKARIASKIIRKNLNKDLQWYRSAFKRLMGYSMEELQEQK